MNYFLSCPKNREELTETRESLQQMKEKLVGQEESFRKKCIDLEADVLSLRKANAELEVITKATVHGFQTSAQTKTRTLLCFYKILNHATSVDLCRGFCIFLCSVHFVKCL